MYCCFSKYSRHSHSFPYFPGVWYAISLIIKWLTSLIPYFLPDVPMNFLVWFFLTNLTRIKIFTVSLLISLFTLFSPLSIYYKHVTYFLHLLFLMSELESEFQESREMLVFCSLYVLSEYREWYNTFYINNFWMSEWIFFL